jgi:hypothetical protein
VQLLERRPLVKSGWAAPEGSIPDFQKLYVMLDIELPRFAAH